MKIDAYKQLSIDEDYPIVEIVFNRGLSTVHLEHLTFLEVQQLLLALDNEHRNFIDHFMKSRKKVRKKK